MEILSFSINSSEIEKLSFSIKSSEIPILSKTASSTILSQTTFFYYFGNNSPKMSFIFGPSELTSKWTLFNLYYSLTTPLFFPLIISISSQLTPKSLPLISYSIEITLSPISSLTKETIKESFFI